MHFLWIGFYRFQCWLVSCRVDCPRRHGLQTNPCELLSLRATKDTREHAPALGWAQDSLNTSIPQTAVIIVSVGRTTSRADAKKPSNSPTPTTTPCTRKSDRRRQVPVHDLRDATVCSRRALVPSVPVFLLGGSYVRRRWFGCHPIFTPHLQVRCRWRCQSAVDSKEVAWMKSSERPHGGGRGSLADTQI